MLAARPGDPKQPQPRARMPAERRRPGEQQERGVRDPPLLRGLLDQAVVAEGLRDRARSDRGPGQELPGKFQVEVVQGRVRAEALLVTDPAVDLFAFVDDFLRLSRHVVAASRQQMSDCVQVVLALHPQNGGFWLRHGSANLDLLLHGDPDLLAP